MVEGGASVISSFLKSGQVDSFLLTIAPVFVGEDGVSAVQDAEVTKGLSLLLIFLSRMRYSPNRQSTEHLPHTRH